MFDHEAYLTQNPTQYDTWLGNLRQGSGVIDVDLDHIAEGHGSEAGDDADSVFTLGSDAAILQAVYNVLSQAAIVFAESNHITVYHNFGTQIGVDGEGTELTAINIVVNTQAMDTEADWENAWVSTAYPLAATL